MISVSGVSMRFGSKCCSKTSARRFRRADAMDDGSERGQIARTMARLEELDVLLLDSYARWDALDSRPV